MTNLPKILLVLITIIAVAVLWYFTLGVIGVWAVFRPL